MRGRTQLAKADFFLRYPKYLNQALAIRHVEIKVDVGEADIESRMIRHRYGPWDPQYFTLLGRLRGRGLIEWVHTGTGVGFRTSTRGKEVAKHVRSLEEWQPIAERTGVIARHLSLSGDTLRKLIYDNFPDVVARPWGAEIPDAA